MVRFNLRFDEVMLSSLADRYSYANDDAQIYEIGERARCSGYFNKEDFQRICRWKTPRSQSRINANSPEIIEEATRMALSSTCEEIRIGVLLLVRGVSWPTASVILHFAHKDPYPIIDYRALWSLGIEERLPFYTFEYWWDYTLHCRKLAHKCKVSMRELDRALWQYSKENQ